MPRVIEGCVMQGLFVLCIFPRMKDVSRLIHRTCQVPKMEVLTYISCMIAVCKAYVSETDPKIAL